MEKIKCCECGELSSGYYQGDTFISECIECANVTVILLPIKKKEKYSRRRNYKDNWNRKN